MSRLLAFLITLPVSTVFLVTGCGNTPKPEAIAKVNLGDVQYQQGRLDDAIISYRKATNIDPSYVKAYIQLGNVLSAKNRLEDASNAYRSASKIEPSY